MNPDEKYDKIVAERKASLSAADQATTARLEKIGETVSGLFVARQCSCKDVLGICLTLAIVAAQSMGMDKLAVQRLIVQMWDSQRADKQAAGIV